MSIPPALEHIDRYGEANLDTVTLRHLREAAIKANEEDERIRSQKPDNQARNEWDPVFARESVERYQAIARIDAELEKRNREDLRRREAERRPLVPDERASGPPARPCR